jgi:hypothetical protein
MMTRLLRLTPVLVVDSVEQCLPFWVDRLGFAAANQVPLRHGDARRSQKLVDVTDLKITRSPITSRPPL